MKALWGHYKKAIIAAGGAGAIAALAALDQSGALNDQPWFGVVLAILTAAGVYKARNIPK